VCGTGGIGSSTAELTWGLILALLRHIPEEDQRLKLAGRAGGAALGVGGGWQRTVGTGLDGKRLGVVGLGKLGQRVAEIGRAFGMKVVAWSQNLDPDVAKKAHAKPVSKEELFSSSDVVTVHYKLSPRSAGLVGAAELALMKPSAYLVNTSAGPWWTARPCWRPCGRGRSRGRRWTCTTSSRCRCRTRCGPRPTWC
jgi:Lactate dehydrogenase and related dehydrogenases